jgi:hypothetical protein
MSHPSVRVLFALVAVAASSTVATAQSRCFPSIDGEPVQVASYDCRFSDAHNIFHNSPVCMVFRNQLGFFSLSAERFGGPYVCGCIYSGTAKNPELERSTRRFSCSGPFPGSTGGVPWAAAFEGRVSQKGINAGTVNIGGEIYSAVFDCKPRTDPAPCALPTPLPSPAPSPTPTP